MNFLWDRKQKNDRVSNFLCKRCNSSHKQWREREKARNFSTTCQPLAINLASLSASRIGNFYISGHVKLYGREREWKYLHLACVFLHVLVCFCVCGFGEVIKMSFNFQQFLFPSFKMKMHVQLGINVRNDILSPSNVTR